MTQMPLANYDPVIQAFASDRADQSFSIAVLPRRSRRCRSVANAHRSNASGKCLCVEPVGTSSQPQASVIWRAIHSAVGCAVTPSHIIRRRPCPRTSNPYSSRNEIVGTTNRSIEAIPSA